MANPRWFMNAGEEGFSILGKAFDKADPAIDAILRVVARRAKSQPGSKFYDPTQEVVEKLPATSWRQALDRMNEIKLTSDKDADVVTPWAWEGPRPGEKDAVELGSLPVGEALKQFDSAAKRTRDRAPKPFGVAWKDYYEAIANGNTGSYKKKARQRASRYVLNGFRTLQRAGVPREWTGEAMTTILRGHMQGAAEYAQNPAVFTGNPNPGSIAAGFLARKNILDRTNRMVDVIQAADVPGMTNKQRSLFFNMYNDLEGTDPEEIGFIIRALAE
jgi:hypothetical protein